MPNERTFLIDYVTRYLGRRPEVSEVLSMWSGLRPLIKAGGGKTSKLSRDHSVLVSPSGIITVAGGKWTTYRKMGEDAINRASEVHNLRCSPSKTANMHLHGWMLPDPKGPGDWQQVYGTDLPGVQTVAASDPQLARKLHPRLPFLTGEVVWAARWEMARTVEDVLARRTRALFLDARAAIEAAPLVADLLARELNRNSAWRERDLQNFNEIAAGYIYTDS